MSVERIARALEGIDASEKHTDECWRRQMHVGAINRCVCDRAVRVRARQAAAVLEALEAAHADGAADDWGRSIGLWETVLPIFERLAGSPRDKEDIPNA